MKTEAHQCPHCRCPNEYDDHGTVHTFDRTAPFAQLVIDCDSYTGQLQQLGIIPRRKAA